MAKNSCRNCISAIRISPGTIIDISSSLRPFPSPHIALNADLQVASENISIKPAKQKNSDIELQACDGNLFAWIMLYINSPSTYPSDRIPAYSCSFGSDSIGLTVEATAVFLFFEEFFLTGATPVISGDSAVSLLLFCWLSTSAASTVLKYGAARASNVCKPLKGKKPTSFFTRALFQVIYTVQGFDGLP